MKRGKAQPRKPESSDGESSTSPTEKKSSKSRKITNACNAPLAEIKQRKERRIKNQLDSLKVATKTGESKKENLSASTASIACPKASAAALKRSRKTREAITRPHFGKQLDRIQCLLDKGKFQLVIEEGEPILQKVLRLDDAELIIRAAVIVGEAYELGDNSEKVASTYFKAVRYSKVYKNPEYRQLLQRLIFHQRKSTPSLDSLRTLLYYHNLVEINMLEDCGYLAKLKKTTKEEKGVVISQLFASVTKVWERKNTEDILKYPGSLEDVVQFFGWFSAEKVSLAIRNSLLAYGERQRYVADDGMDVDATGNQNADTTEGGDGGGAEAMEEEDHESKTNETIDQFLTEIVSTINFGSDLCDRIGRLRTSLKGDGHGAFLLELLKNVMKGSFYIAIGKLKKASEYFRNEDYDAEKHLDDSSAFFQLLKRGVRVRQKVLESFRFGPCSEKMVFEDFAIDELEKREGPYNALDYLDVVIPRIHMMLARGDWDQAQTIASRETQIDGFNFWTHPTCHVIKAGMHIRMVDILFKGTSASFYNVLALGIDAEGSNEWLQCYVTLEDLYWLLCAFLALQMSSRIPHMEMIFQKMKTLFPMRGKTAALDALTFALNGKQTEGYDKNNEEFAVFATFVIEKGNELYQEVRQDYECKQNNNSPAILDQPLAIANYVIKRDESYVEAFQLLEDALNRITGFTPFSVFLCINEVVDVWLDCQDKIY